MKRLLLRVLAFGAGSLGFLSAPLTATDWPQWRGLNRNGISSEKVAPFPSAGPRLIWTSAVGTGFSSIAVTGNHLYTMGNTNEHDVVWCLEAASGQVVWTQSAPSRADPQFYEGGPGATPTVAEGKVFTINKWGTVLCLDAATGSKVWEHNLWDEGIRSNRWGFAGSPLVWNNLIILNAGAAGTALDRRSGRLAWFNGTEPAGYASPVLATIGRQDVVLIFAAKDLVAVDPKTGQERWRHRFETGYDTNNMDPIVVRDTVFLSSYSRGCELLRLRADKAGLIYAKDVLHNHLSPGILFGDYLYAFNGEAKHETDFRCIHLPSGRLMWSSKTPAFGSVIGLPEDRLLLLSEKGELTLAAASPAEFKPLSRAQVMGGVCWIPPTLAHGHIYARNAKGDLKCFDIKK